MSRGIVLLQIHSTLEKISLVVGCLAYSTQQICFIIRPLEDSKNIIVITISVTVLPLSENNDEYINRIKIRVYV
jgi:hypothetical protein